MSAMILCVVKTIVLWFVLWLVGMNLMGMLVGPIFHLALSDNPALDIVPREEHRKQRYSLIGSGLFLLLLAVGYLSLVMRFGGSRLLIAALMLMVVRLPEQIHEVTAGERASNRATRIDVVTHALWFGALPVIWWAICY